MRARFRRRPRASDQRRPSVKGLAVHGVGWRWATGRGRPGPVVRVTVGELVSGRVPSGRPLGQRSRGRHRRERDGAFVHELEPRNQTSVPPAKETLSSVRFGPPRLGPETTISARSSPRLRLRSRRARTAPHTRPAERPQACHPSCPHFRIHEEAGPIYHRWRLGATTAFAQSRPSARRGQRSCFARDCEHVGDRRRRCRKGRMGAALAAACRGRRETPRFRPFRQ